jgi:sulfur-oxidizing protein SoxZ
VPRKIIKAFVASFNGQLVFRAERYPSISANPYEAFYFRGGGKRHIRVRLTR